MITRYSSVAMLILLCTTGALAQYDGSWSGQTSQSKPISFEIAANAFTQLKFGGRIAPGGCTSDFDITVTYTTPRPLNGSNISLISTSTAPGSFSFNVSGTFSSTTTASGTITFTVNAIPGVPSCSGSGSATWSMTRSGSEPTACSYSISPQQNTTVASTGGSGNVTITGAPSGCSGNWSASSNASWITITSGSSGSGAGPATLGYSIAANTTASQRTGTLTIAGQIFTVIQQGTSQPGLNVTHILTVIGSSPGSGGSYFKTSVQLHNPGTSAISGRLVFHPAGTPGSGSDPFMVYSLAPGQTIDYVDILPTMGLGGLGSLDVMTEGDVPLIVGRIYNDGGDQGTTGMSIEPVAADDVLRPGDEAILLAPIDPVQARLNIGVRTMSEGLSVMIRVRDRSGTTRTTLTKSYPGTYFEQVTSAAFTGLTLNASDVIVISVNSGRGIFYGASTDNKTQDPSIQIAKPRM